MPKAISLTVRCITVLSSARCPMRPHEVARRLGKQSNSVRVILGRLADSGKVQRVAVAGCPTPAYVIPSDDDGPYIWDLFGVR